MSKLIIISAFFFCACKTVKQNSSTVEQKQEQHDSVYVERVKFDTIKFKASSASTKIPLSLINQPGLPVIEKKSGNATVRLRVVHDTVYAEAECDSLQRVIATYEKQIESYRRERDFRKAVFDKKTVKTPWWYNVIWIVVIAFVILIIAIACYNYFNRKKPF